MAAQQASGILEIHGNPAGTVYFDQGQITFAVGGIKGSAGGRGPPGG
jgi:hypothetical protein